MSALQMLVTAILLLLIGGEFALHRRRRRLAMMRRAAAAGANFPGVAISARAGTERDGIAAGTPHVPVEAADPSAENHTGAGACAGERPPGPGVTADGMDAMDGMDAGKDPQRCVRCHHFHLDASSLICGGCREVMSHLPRCNEGGAE